MNRQGSHARIRQLTITAMLSAIIWFLTFTPIGFTLPFFGVSMTFVHIPMIVGTLIEGLGVGTALGLMFGLSSLFKNITMPTSIYSPMFQNPLVSVLPRLLAPIIVWAVLRLMRRLFPGAKPASYAVAALFGALANTVLTLSALSLSLALSSGGFTGVSYASIWALSINAVFEGISAIVVCVPIASALDAVYARTK